ncbi:hypothetical protein O9G_000184 [Rozella allomycis CSF55]|uniref:RFTS domain-containing protein n=1 Tax=Rozella allomycis (strain CSF55) TaxID=988480 RepID=A0A075ANZ0_ROZAC|nr:hypothetical protein O9G_000184 [Rozella allomycis CSF55]|eukprot:EPZ31705.1 hypothetical protein O9G_000184 [Rozella allomycis CSF55]
MSGTLSNLFDIAKRGPFVGNGIVSAENKAKYPNQCGAKFEFKIYQYYITYYAETPLKPDVWLRGDHCYFRIMNPSFKYKATYEECWKMFQFTSLSFEYLKENKGKSFDWKNYFETLEFKSQESLIDFLFEVSSFFMNQLSQMAEYERDCGDHIVVKLMQKSLQTKSNQFKGLLDLEIDLPLKPLVAYTKALKPQCIPPLITIINDLNYRNGYFKCPACYQSFDTSVDGVIDNILLPHIQQHMKSLCGDLKTEEEWLGIYNSSAAKIKKHEKCDKEHYFSRSFPSRNVIKSNFGLIKGVKEEKVCFIEPEVEEIKVKEEVYSEFDDFVDIPLMEPLNNVENRPVRETRVNNQPLKKKRAKSDKPESSKINNADLKQENEDYRLEIEIPSMNLEISEMTLDEESEEEKVFKKRRIRNRKDKRRRNRKEKEFLPEILTFARTLANDLLTFLKTFGNDNRSVPFEGSKEKEQICFNVMCYFGLGIVEAKEVYDTVLKSDYELIEEFITLAEDCGILEEISLFCLRPKRVKTISEISNKFSLDELAEKIGRSNKNNVEMKTRQSRNKRNKQINQNSTKSENVSTEDLRKAIEIYKKKFNVEISIEDLFEILENLNEAEKEAEVEVEEVKGKSFKVNEENFDVNENFKANGEIVEEMRENFKDKREEEEIPKEERREIFETKAEEREDEDLELEETKIEDEKNDLEIEIFDENKKIDLHLALDDFIIEDDPEDLLIEDPEPLRDPEPQLFLEPSRDPEPQISTRSKPPLLIETSKSKVENLIDVVEIEADSFASILSEYENSNAPLRNLQNMQ